MSGRPPKLRLSTRRDEIRQEISSVVANFARAAEREKLEQRLGRPIVERTRPAVESDELSDSEREPGL